MSIYRLSIMIIFLLSLSYAHLRNCKPYPGADYYILALQWQPGVCRVQSCTRKNEERFTIHGLWAMQSPQLQLVKCGGESFKWDKIATIQRNLRAYWPNLKGRKENERYWNYEWYKHGTCTPFGVFDYFNNTVQITRGIDLEVKLFEVGVELGYSYELLQFQSAIEETFGEELNIGTRCEKDVDDNFALVEVHFCINLKQQLMKCKVNSPGDCNKREFILYISTKKH